MVLFAFCDVHLFVYNRSNGVHQSTVSVSLSDIGQREATVDPKRRELIRYCTCSSLTVHAHTKYMVDVEIPAIDDRRYRHIKLSNGLQVLLIEDPTSDKAAAAMAVGVGQLSDGEWPGLAHLTEHMVFMGSERYPDENEYDRFLSQHGGHSNAYTDMQVTNYYLDVQAKHLRGALDRLAAALEAPLLAEGSVAREISAVDSEHAKNTTADHWRYHQLARTLLGVGHVYGGFGTGSKESLSAHDTAALRAAVTGFYERYYRAPLMRGVVLGTESLDELEALVHEMFAKLPAGVEEPPSPVPHLMPKLPQRVHVVPVSDTTTLELQWPIRETQSLYRSKPTRFLSHLLGHEGPGSLLALLRERHWAQELVADDQSKSFTAFAIFSLEVELTETGLAHVDEVIELVFAYLAVLKAAPMPDWVYTELKNTADMQFRFLSKIAPSSTVSNLAPHLHQYPIEHAVSGPYLLYDWQPELITDCLVALHPDNMLVMVSAKAFAGATDETDPWYGTEYRCVDVGEPVLVKWRHPTKTIELRLPDRNDMLATEFGLVEPLQLFTKENATPLCLLDTELCRLWYKPDTVFGQPKVNIMMTLRSSLAYVASPKHSVLASLWVEAMHEHVKDFSYAASMAGLHCDFSNTRSGVEIHVSGYNHKADILLSRIVDAVKTLPESLNEAVFLRMVDKLRNQFKSFLVAQPYQHGMYAADLCLEDLKWKMQDRLASLDDVKHGDLLAFCGELLSRFFLEMLVHGNVSAGQAKSLATAVLDGWKPQAPLSLPTVRVVQLPLAEPIYRFRGWNEQDNNSCCLAIFQVGPDTDIVANATLSLFHHLMREPAFNRLRTEEQLGYIVHTGAKTNGDGIKSLLCLIQSDAYDPLHIDERIEAFLLGFRSFLVHQNAEDFAINVTSVCQNLLEKNKNLGEESSKHWTAINNRSYRFHRLVEVADKVATVTQADVLRFYDRYILATSPYRRKLSVQVFGSNHVDKLKEAPRPGCTMIDDPKAFVESHFLFPTRGSVDIESFIMSSEV